MNRYRFLIVENRAGSAMDLEERLAGMGYLSLGRVAKGDPLLEIVREHRPDMVLMDVRHRGLAGAIRTALQIRGHFRLPVFFITARSEGPLTDRKGLCDPFAAIRDPFDASEFRSLLETATNRSELDSRQKRIEMELRESNDRRSALFEGARDAILIADADTGIPLEANTEAERLLGGPRAEMIGLAAEQALRESEERYRSLVETTCDWIWEVDTHGRYSYASPKVIDILGYAPEEIVGRTPFEFMSQEEALRISRIFAEIDVERKPFAGLINVNLHRDGRQVVLESSGVPVFGRDGEFQGYRGMDRDITERKASDLALFESEERLKLALDASHMGVWEWDVPTGTVYWSPECCGILGVEDLRGTIEAFTDAVHSEDVARITASAKRALKERTAYAEEYRIIRRDGELRWVSNFARTSYDRNGRPLRVVGTIQDITDRKQAEERRNQVEAQLRHGQKMEALGTLAGGIAHDFNNILTIISGYAEMACWGLAAENPLHDELRQILNATDRARDLVQQILAFSRRSEQEKRPVQVDSIVKEALKMLRASLPSTIEIKSKVTSKTFALADPTQIHQVLMNLCTNASHAMRERGGLLEVSLTDVRISPEIARFHTGLQPGPHVQLAVRDTGHGIDPSVLDRIFDPFFTTKEPGAGTGLGLSVVHGIVKSHGGAIEVESAPGEGAAFYVFIPAMESVAEPDPEELDALPCGHERILFVDDEPILATAAKRMLERLGYEVDYRPDGFEALLAYRRSLTGKPFDLVITDMTMPQLTGAELARELLRDRPELPVILSTGFSENMDEDKAEEIGARGFLMKPYTWRQLADLVRKVLARD